jgi:hypothetical protein
MKPRSFSSGARNFFGTRVVVALGSRRLFAFDVSFDFAFDLSFVAAGSDSSNRAAVALSL